MPTSWGRISCELLITNTTDQRKNFTLYRQYGFRDDLLSYAQDGAGNQYVAEQVSLGANTTSDHFVSLELESQLPTKASVIFKGALADTSSVTVVLVYQTVSLAKVILRNAPFAK